MGPPPLNKVGNNSNVAVVLVPALSMVCAVILFMWLVFSMCIGGLCCMLSFT